MRPVVPTLRDRSIRLIEVPFNSAGLITGVARMPAVLADAGLRNRLSEDGPLSLEHITVTGLVPQRGPSGLLTEDALTRMVRDVSSAALRAWSEDNIPLVVAGDCPTLLGALAALEQQGGGGMVFVDGHEDAWPLQGRTSGEASDSEIALALGLQPAPSELDGILPCLKAEHLLMLGARDAAEIEAEGAVSVRDQILFRDGAWLKSAPLDQAIPPLVDQSAGAAPAGWWLHIDLDVLSTDAFPAVDYPQPGGISWSRLSDVTKAVLSRPRCRGMSVVIYNPDLDAGKAAVKIIDYLARTADLLRSAK